jgi:hypothetical protein
MKNKKRNKSKDNQNIEAACEIAPNVKKANNCNNVDSSCKVPNKK